MQLTRQQVIGLAFQILLLGVSFLVLMIVNQIFNISMTQKIIRLGHVNFVQLAEIVLESLADGIK